MQGKPQCYNCKKFGNVSKDCPSRIIIMEILMERKKANKVGSILGTPQLSA